MASARVSAYLLALGSVSGAILTWSFIPTRRKGEDIKDGFCGATGNTPLVELKTLSKLTGCRILAKAEHMNPSGSIKDRAACSLLRELERSGKLKPGGTVIEATGGNTGIALALGSRRSGHKAIFTMPESIASEKIESMALFGAEPRLCPPVPFSDPRNYYQQAAQLEKEIDGAVWTNQFETLANFRAHFEGTGPEIWRQTGGRVDGFVCAAGTGGTIAGCSAFLKSKNPEVKCYLIDPPGSSLLHYVATGTLQASQGSSVQEGIGIGRITANFAQARLDGAFAGSDQEAVDMAYHLLREEGIFVGPSGALNVMGAVKLAELLGPGHTIVTVLCDTGDRYRSKLYSAKWLEQKRLTPSKRRIENSISAP